MQHIHRKFSRENNPNLLPGWDGVEKNFNTSRSRLTNMAFFIAVSTSNTTI